VSSAAERFAEKYLSGDGCWQWISTRTKKGYGHFWFDGAPWQAHRVSYVLNVGEIPHGMHVLHRCDNPGCVRPDHLFLGSNMDNVADKIAKGRHPRGSAASCAKLTETEAASIRADTRSHRAIGEAFGVSHTVVWSIKKGAAWTHA
jgi:hypothetical protein